MRVLHVINALGLGGGAERSMVAMLPLLAERGVESSIVCLVPRIGGLEAEVRADGYPLVVLGTDRLPGSAWRLRREVRRQRPDLVHASMFDACLASRFAGIGSGVPVLNSLVNLNHSPDRFGEVDRTWKHEVVRHVDGFTSRHLVTRVHAVSGAVRDMGVEALGLDPADITVVPRGRSREVLGQPSPERRARVRSELGLDDGSLLVLTVGRQDLMKGHRVLAEAFAAAAAGLPGAVLAIVGREGPASAELAQAIEAAGPEVDIRVLGHRDDVPDLLAAADLFAFPSYSEGIPGAVIEAMAMGVPVIGSDAPSVADVLGGGRYGLVVPRGDVAALAAALTDLGRDGERRRDLATVGRARFAECYEIGQVADQMVQLYRELVGART